MTQKQLLVDEPTRKSAIHSWKRTHARVPSIYLVIHEYQNYALQRKVVDHRTPLIA